MSSYEVDGKLLTETFITITDVECVCCRDDFHDVIWDYETAEDNMCGDGCMIEGTCLNCGATGRGEFSNQDVDFEVGDL